MGEHEHAALDELRRRTGRDSFPAHGSVPGHREDPGDGARRVSPRMAMVVVVVAAGAGWMGWHLLARPAPIEDRMAVAAAADTGAGADTASGTSAGSGDGDAAGAVADAAAGDGVGDGSAGSTVATVHVAGAVGSPGVVQLPVSSRVADALAAAGGALGSADLDRLNLAAPLLDGSRILVPTIGADPVVEVPTSASPGGIAGPGGRSDGTSALVNMNTADAAALEELPGVGPATAEAILSHREKSGPFRSVEDLLEVRGIGDAKLEALRDLVTVG